jgi:hypothetical protein
MRCPKCNYFFSEELRTCPRCGADMGSEIEKLGIFPPSAEEPFLTIDDFIEAHYTTEPLTQERVIDFSFPEGET